MSNNDLHETFHYITELFGMQSNLVTYKYYTPRKRLNDSIIFGVIVHKTLLVRSKSYCVGNLSSKKRLHDYMELNLSNFPSQIFGTGEM